MKTKTIFSLMAAMALTLTFGLAYADELPTWENKNTITTIHEELSGSQKSGAGLKGAAPGGTRADKADCAKSESDKHQSYWNADRATD
jgi:hypothetical protein